MPVVAPVKSSSCRAAIACASACAFSTSASLVFGDASPADPITPTLIFIDNLLGVQLFWGIQLLLAHLQANCFARSTVVLVPPPLGCKPRQSRKQKKSANGERNDSGR